MKNNPSLYTKAFRLLFLLFLTNTIGYIGSTFTTPQALDWYHTLILSDLTPPDMWFGIVWSLLYILIAVAGWLVWGKVSTKPYVLQLAFNLLWPFLFFYLQSPVWGLIGIVFILYYIIRTIQVFYPVSKPAAWLMIPVLIWCGFAFYLNLITVLYNTQIGLWLGLI